MNYILALFTFSHFFILAQANTRDRLAVRSSAFENAHQPTVLIKRQFGGGFPTSSNPTAGSQLNDYMTCYISRKYPKATGKASDCFRAIAQLYIIQPSPPCAICGTCAIGSPCRMPPSYSQADMNAAYDNYARREKYCPNYRFPPGFTRGNLPPAGTLYTPYLFGVNEGQGNSCKACSAQLTNEIVVNGG
ncbi:secreted protein [Melampsora americana]|nr:secreted protein [Melampsora americana]